MEAITDRDTVVMRSGVHALRRRDGRGAAASKLLVRAGSGLDNIDLDYARAPRHPRRAHPGMSAPPVAEFTFALCCRWPAR